MYFMLLHGVVYINGLVQDCSNSIANALELLQSCTKPLILCYVTMYCTFVLAPGDNVVVGQGVVEGSVTVTVKLG